MADSSVPGLSRRIELYWRKTIWVIIGIFAPEIVIYTAWSQWNSARKLTAKVAKLLDNDPAAKGARKYTWTMTHSFFAGMGGFVVDTNDPDRPPYIPDSPRLIITAQGIAILAECGQLPDISRRDLDDKNKADNAAKALALLQAS
ncbi:MAG: hypothetical protein LQ350_003297 [Teloschistes chrysophthalmus]|nr:MAG: hypothetical protein LQ350_003297 [Niorma chrysophthalma]